MCRKRIPYLGSGFYGETIQYLRSGFYVCAECSHESLTHTPAHRHDRKRKNVCLCMCVGGMLCHVEWWGCLSRLYPRIDQRSYQYLVLSHVILRVLVLCLSHLRSWATVTSHSPHWYMPVPAIGKWQNNMLALLALHTPPPHLGSSTLTRNWGIAGNTAALLDDAIFSRANYQWTDVQDSTRRFAGCGRSPLACVLCWGPERHAVY